MKSSVSCLFIFVLTKFTLSVGNLLLTSFLISRNLNTFLITSLNFPPVLIFSYVSCVYASKDTCNRNKPELIIFLMISSVRREPFVLK